MARSRGPGTAGWHSIAIFPKNAKEFYGQIVLVGYTGQPFSSFSSPFTNAVPAGTKQLRSRLALGYYERTLEAQGLLNTPPPTGMCGKRATSSTSWWSARPGTCSFCRRQPISSATSPT